MNRRTGFTLVELLITITIMAILMTLSVFSLRSVQANARDEKRTTDVEAISKGLEIRYIEGNPKASSTDIKKGYYPGTNEMLHAKGSSRAGYTPSEITGGYLTELLPGTNKKTFSPPGNGTLEIMCVWLCQPAETQTVIESETTISRYVYEPINANGNICSDDMCVRYNLYYRAEKDNVVQKVMSKRQ